ncbi:DUF6752 domain-containing protein [Cryobacterium tepidiphilum]|uniref:DUF6752 domain-containing protein n=1 Tax=Cryobacterium tepidiphilum TaxID=2486026 RepID=A0A3M8L372_9MICO|nr:DUF6752 domain-containing protein [Cryobacterium tepidiphilum]RNE59084.1 hypothetical protein EEJ31_11240 [Cryobacterium tepidiphilum]
MENFLGRLLAKVAPRAARALTTLIHVSEEDDALLPKVIAYENQVRELRQEIDELRKDNLRIAELYDLVFERLNQRL